MITMRMGRPKPIEPSPLSLDDDASTFVGCAVVGHCVVGKRVGGIVVGIIVGTLVGLRVGAAVGISLGAAVGDAVVGTIVGDAVGAVGAAVGAAVGCLEPYTHCVVITEPPVFHRQPGAALQPDTLLYLHTSCHKITLSI